MSKPVLKESEVNITIKDVFRKHTLNFTDIVGNSNKCYSIEGIEATDGEFYIYTQYGRVAGTLAKEYRVCDDKDDAEKEIAKIVKSKVKKGYHEIKLVKHEIGSEIGKSKIEASTISEDGAKKLGFKIKEETKSSLHPAVQELVKGWFGSIEKFVIDTLDTSKCALGQLSLEQINKGRDILLEARKIVSAGGKDVKELTRLSNAYYSAIPTNFSYQRLNADQLRFDNDNKLDRAFDILDTLENAKDAEKVLTKKNAIDEQYKSLNTGMEWVDPNDPIWKWVEALFSRTRAHNHQSLGRMKVCNIFRLTRNKEHEEYMTTVEKLAGDKKHARQELPSMIKPLWGQRIREHKDYEAIYDKANVLPLWHGSRTPNMPKILSSFLAMRKPHFTVAGSMFDGQGGLYFAGHASKSCQYSSAAGSIWAAGSDKKGYLLLSDVCLGRQKIATSAYPYTLNGIAPAMSVWAKSGGSLVNDEFIVYTEQQNWLRFVVEFETQCK